MPEPVVLRHLDHMRRLGLSPRSMFDREGVLRRLGQWLSHPLLEATPEELTAWQASQGAGVSLSALGNRYGSRMYALSKDLRELQELMGHGSPNTTAGYVASKARRPARRPTASAAHWRWRRDQPFTEGDIMTQPPQGPQYGPPPGQQPPYGPPPGGQQYPPQGGPPAQPPKKRKKWPFILGGIVLLIIVISIASSSGGSKSTTAAATSTAAAPTTTTAAPAATSQQAAAPAPTTTQAPTTTTTTQAPTTTPPAPAGLSSDNGWTLQSIQTKDDGLGDFGGTARISNDSGKSVKGALIKVTLLQGSDVVATLNGSANDVAAGKTITVEFISQDKYRSGKFTPELQMDGTF